MTAIYGYERFNYPTTKFVHLKSAVTGGIGASNNPGYTATSGLGAKDVGAIVDVTNSTGAGAFCAQQNGK